LSLIRAECASSKVLFCLFRTYYDEFNQDTCDIKAEIEELIETVTTAESVEELNNADMKEFNNADMEEFIEGINADIEHARECSIAFIENINTLLPFHPTVFHEFETSFDNAVSDDGGLKQAVSDLNEAGLNYCMDRASAAYLKSKKSIDKLKETQIKGLKSITRIVESSDRWRKNAQLALRQLFTNVVNTSIDNIDQMNDPIISGQIIQLLREELIPGKISELVKTLFLNNEYILMGDNIPIKKETNARDKCKIPNDESIVALIDMTVFGSAKNVICITKRSIYWNGIWTSKQPGPGKALFSELNSASFEILDGQHIQVTPDKWVSDNGSSMSTKDIQTFLIGLRDLKLF
jgi:hypothetical protein